MWSGASACLLLYSGVPPRGSDGAGCEAGANRTFTRPRCFYSLVPEAGVEPALGVLPRELGQEAEQTGIAARYGRLKRRSRHDEDRRQPPESELLHHAHPHGSRFPAQTQASEIDSGAQALAGVIAEIPANHACPGGAIARDERAHRSPDHIHNPERYEPPAGKRVF